MRISLDLPDIYVKVSVIHTFFGKFYAGKVRLRVRLLGKPY